MRLSIRVTAAATIRKKGAELAIVELSAVRHEQPPALLPVGMSKPASLGVTPPLELELVLGVPASVVPPERRHACEVSLHVDPGLEEQSAVDSHSTQTFEVVSQNGIPGTAAPHSVFVAHVVVH